VRTVFRSLCAVLILLCVPGAQAVGAANNGVALSPPMGWSSWSAFHGNISEDSIKAMAQVQAATLKSSGYVYVNIDAGWYANPDAALDSYGRWLADPAKFPGGMAALGRYIHDLGLKFGLYLTPGVPALAVVYNTPIEGTPYHAADIAIAGRLEQTYLGGTMYYINYNAPGAQAFINSWANLLASWGVDYLKLDAVGDWNIPDVQAWSAALRQTGRPIHLELSADLNPANAAVWRTYANGWRISSDIEAYNGVSLTSWDRVMLRFTSEPRWLAAGGSGGWNDLDSLAVAGTNTGLTADERRTVTTLWALSASPLVVGDDLRTADALGLSLLTNPEVIGIDQNGAVAAPVSAGAQQQVWVAPQPDGTYAVGFFNLAATAARVTVAWSDVGFAGPATVRDLWARTDLGAFTTNFSAQLNAHASALIRVSPSFPAQRIPASRGALAAWAVFGSSPVSPGGIRAQYVGFGSTITFAHVSVAAGGWYNVTIGYINGDAAPRSAVLNVNGYASSVVNFPSAGDWATNTTRQSVTVAAWLVPGDTTLSLSNSMAWAPDLDSITIQPRAAPAQTFYKVVSALTGKVLDAAFASTTPAVPIIQWPDYGAVNQQWTLSLHADGTYHLTNRLSGYALETPAPQIGIPLDQMAYGGGANQVWRIVAAGNGAVVLINQGTGLLAHASADWNGAKVDQTPAAGANDQLWLIVPVM
jgi:alpha-galactosidase